MEEDLPPERKAPYLSFSTLKNLLYELGSKPLPPQIDRSLMSGRSGTDQSYLLGALKFFGFIDEQQNVLPLFVKWGTEGDDERKATFARLIWQQYPSQMVISTQNGTSQKLLESFSTEFSYSGNTRRKAMTFFLQCATWAGVEMSVHFKVNKMGNGQPAVLRGKRTPRKKTGPKVNKPPASTVEGSGERLSVWFGDAGTVEVIVKVAWLKLDGPTFTGLRAALTELEGLGYVGAPGNDDEVPDDFGDEEEEDD